MGPARYHAFMSFPQAWPNLSPHCLFLFQLALGKIAELERLRRHPNQLIDPDPFERPVPPLRRMSAERSVFDV